MCRSKHGILSGGISNGQKVNICSPILAIREMSPDKLVVLPGCKRRTVQAE